MNTGLEFPTGHAGIKRPRMRRASLQALRSLVTAQLLRELLYINNLDSPAQIPVTGY